MEKSGDRATGRRFSSVVAGVMFSVRFASFRSVMMGMMTMAGCGVRVVGSSLVIVVFVMLCGFAVMLRSFLVMFGCIMMMLAGGVLVRHLLLLEERHWPYCQAGRSKTEFREAKMFAARIAKNTF
jgi:high-affinity Fe2+/Pb2+ permease